MISTPILVVAYNRPHTLTAQLQRIENLTTRNVLISIDGPRSSSLELRNQTVNVALVWQKRSHHNVEVIPQQSNLGIYEHLPIALENFFTRFVYGIILEDDIEFTPDYIDFVDNNWYLLENPGYWSLCGHNPIRTKNPYASHFESTSFRPSRFHSIWGWATSRSVAMTFVSRYKDELNFQFAYDVLSETSKRITRDPFLRQAFVATWLRKLDGWKKRRPQSSWDTRWVYAAWRENKLSLIPETSLSRESLDQSEGQTHTHQTFGEVWTNPHNTHLKFTVDDLHRRKEIDFLSTWGIHRRYSWAFSLRLRKEINRLTR